jgi:hypothetical protein
MNLMKRVGIACAFQLFFLLYTHAQVFTYTPNCILAINAIEKLQLEKARTLLDEERKKMPDNTALDYLDDCADYYELITSGDKEQFTALEKLKSERIVRLQKLSSTSVLAAYAEAEIQLHWSILKLMQNEYVSGAMELRTAYQLHQKNFTKYPQFTPTKKSIGFMKAILGTLPDNYNWILNIVGLKGNFKEGISLIEEYLEQPKFTPEQDLDKQQANFYYVLLNFYYGDKQLAWNHTQQQTLDYSENMLSCYLRAFIASHTAKTDEAIAILNKRPKGADFSKYPELDFLMGYAKLNKLETDADIEFKKFVTFSKNNNIKKDAYERLAWSEWIQHDTLRYFIYRRIAFNTSSNKDDEDIQVDKNIEKGIYPNVDVLKARLLFDGGFYVQAENMFKEIAISSLKGSYQQSEYYYRYGRVMQEQKKYAKAIEYFTESIKIAHKSNLYFAPYSSLQLGNIYSKLGYAQTAEFYYNKATTYKNYKDQGYITQKAKQALLGIRD